MNHEKVNNGSATDNETQPSGDGANRAFYVSRELKPMIDFVAKVYNHLGHTEHHSNKAIATAHGLSPLTIKPHLSCAQQYKLLELKHGVGYKITEHFQKLYLPKNDNEKRAAVIESLKTPKTYQQLFKDYEYHVVPSSDGVKNHFIRNFGFKEEVAIKAAQVFLDNLKTYELVDGRGVLTSAMPSKPIVPEVTAKEEEGNGGSGSKEAEEYNGTPAPPKNPPPAIIHSNEYTENSKYRDHIWIPIHITKGKTAVFAYPEEISENDIKIVEHQLAGILLRIRLENEEKNKGAEAPQ